MKTANIFTDNMVLQREQKVPVWGWAEPEEQITVEFVGHKKRTVTENSGRWLTHLAPMDASSNGQSMHIYSETTTDRSDEKEITLRNILIGDVWLASGQSNMRKPIPGNSLPADAACPQLRLFRIDTTTTPSERDLGSTAGWGKSSLQNFHTLFTSGDTKPFGFSQVGYCFGRRIQEMQSIPIGIIQSAYGGSPIAAWTPNPDSNTLYDSGVEAERPQNQPGILYRCMFQGMLPFAVRGIVWYQGESDVSNLNYAHDMKKWITCWRSDFESPDLPVCFVQIAPTGFGSGTMNNIWQAQCQFAAEDPHAWMAPTNDIYMGNELDFNLRNGRYIDSDDPHPPNLHIIGNRLANIALETVYGMQSQEVFGPSYQSHKTSGTSMDITFAHTAEGLITRDGTPPVWFEVSGPDSVFTEVPAEIVASDKIRLDLKNITVPTHFRFAWHGQAVHNLMNSQGLPAVPFTENIIADCGAVTA